MQTDTATDRALTIDLPARLNSASQESDRSSWYHRLVLRPADLTVEVWSLYGAAMPEELWHDRVISLGTLSDGLADLTPVREALEARDADVLLLAGMHEVVWDGHNRVGRFTGGSESESILESIRDAIDEAGSACARLWDASEWLAHTDDTDLFPADYDGSDDAREARARALVEAARWDAALDWDDIAGVLHRRWAQVLDEAEVECEEAELFNDGADANVNFVLTFAGQKIAGTATLYFDQKALDWTVCGDCVCWLSLEVRERLDKLAPSTARRLMERIRTEAGYAALDAGLAAE